MRFGGFPEPFLKSSTRFYNRWRRLRSELLFREDLRDKEKREVDFLVVRDGKPWFLAEVKTSGRRGISPALPYFEQQLDAKHAFQVVFDLDFVDRDCFGVAEPVRVPATTFLSQLV